jgi:hypothetical protein
MPKVNKIVQYGLEKEVSELVNAGFSQDEIASHLRQTHPEISDLTSLSAMSINRYLKTARVNEYLEEMEDGKDPEEALRAEFREKMYELEEQTIEVYKIMRTELKKIANNADSIDVIRAAKDVLTSMEQRRKNWSTLLEQAYRQFGTFGEAKQTNLIQVNNFMLDLSRELCPNCRKKVVELVLTKENEGLKSDEKVTKNDTKDAENPEIVEILD